MPMNPLDPNPAVLLDYLYGLLDKPQHEQVEDLLKPSPEWRAALEQARGHQGILAAAAKASFPEVSFRPPTHRAERAEPEPTQILKIPAARRPWLRYALAASV